MKCGHFLTLDEEELENHRQSFPVRWVVKIVVVFVEVMVVVGSW